MTGRHYLVVALAISCLVPRTVDASAANPRPGCFGEADGVTDCKFGRTEFIIDTINALAGLFTISAFFAYFAPGFPLIPADKVSFGTEVLPGSLGTFHAMASDFARGMELIWHLQTICVLGMAKYANSHFSDSFRMSMYELRWSNIYGDAPDMFNIDKLTHPYTFSFVGNIFYVAIGWIYIFIFYFALYTNYFVGNIVLQRIRRQHRPMKPPRALHPWRCCTVYALFTYQGLVASSTRMIMAVELDGYVWISLAGLVFVVTVGGTVGLMVTLLVRLQQAAAYNKLPRKLAYRNVKAAWRYKIHTATGIFWKWTTVAMFILRKGEWTMPPDELERFGHLFAGFNGLNRFYILYNLVLRLFLALVIGLTEWMPAISLHIILAFIFGARMVLMVVFQPFVDRADTSREIVVSTLEFLVFFLIAIFSLRDYVRMLPDSEYLVFDAQMEMLIVVGMLFRLATLIHVFLRQVMLSWNSVSYLVIRWLKVSVAIVFFYDEPMMRVLGRDAEEELQLQMDQRKKKEMREAKAQFKKMQAQMKKNGIVAMDEEGGEVEGGLDKSESQQRLRDLIADEQAAADEESAKLPKNLLKHEKKLKESKQTQPVRVQLTVVGPRETMVKDLTSFNDALMHTFGIQNRRVLTTTAIEDVEDIKGNRHGGRWLVFVFIWHDKLLDSFDLASRMVADIRAGDGNKLEVLFTSSSAPKVYSNSMNKEAKLHLVSAVLSSDHDQYRSLVDVSAVMLHGGVRAVLEPQNIIENLALATDIEANEMTFIRTHHVEKQSQVVRIMILPMHEHGYRQLKNKEYLNSELTGTHIHISKVRFIGMTEAEEKKNAFGMLGTFARMNKVKVIEDDPLQPENDFLVEMPDEEAVEVAPAPALEDQILDEKA